MFVCLFIYLCFVVLGLNSGPTPWATPPALFCEGFFWNRVPWIICLGWLQIVILLISASWVNKITGMNHQHPTEIFIYLFNFFALGFELRAYPLSHSTSPFLWWAFFEIRFHELLLQIAILLISASWEAEIMGVSHQCPAEMFIF
jgi:hypothetical protein